ncbi:FKBP-type peptidyl-prolyl cis-trans isomerase [Formosa haliotis]|uniref:FKBP-type peptidyl-prolyl cis-trans isomerase n=1 Tax=Formosa haliotis TaxID=1555194 RepID=UPI0008256681
MKSVCIALCVILFVSCTSDDNFSNKDYSLENEQEIAAYVEANNLDATRTESGLYYVIDEVGAGSEITSKSDIAVHYKGYTTDGKVFGESNETGAVFNLSTVISGWQEGLKFFNEGGSGMLLIPAHLAYGSNDYNGIKGGSVLIFEIEIIDHEAENKAEILDYIAANGLNAMATESGLYYVMEEEGTGENPTVNSNVTVAYTGYLTDGKVFDQSSDAGATFDLKNLIKGWQIGLPLFKEGGKGILIIPSSLAYGKYGSNDIPSGAVVLFDISLLKVN